MMTGNIPLLRHADDTAQAVNSKRIVWPDKEKAILTENIT